MKKVIAAILAMLMLLQVCTVSFAFESEKLTQAEWDAVYASLKDGNTLPTLNVGADETQVNLCWHVNKENAQPKVRVSKSADMADAIEFSGATTPAETETQVVCRVTVTGLEENTKYFYQYYADNGWSKAYEYETKSFGSHKALVIGDIQIGGQSKDDPTKQSADGFTWNSVLTEALAKNPDVSYLVSPGDNTSTGKTSSEWQTFLMPENLRSLPVALAIGNHDKKGFAYNYFNNNPNEFYGNYFEGLDRDFWFRHGDVLYLVFDATSPCAADHMAMAKQAVKENPDAKWRIGIMHQALFAAGYSTLDAETMILLNAVFTPIFDTYDVDLVLTGHSHLQGRSHFMYESSMIGKAESGKIYKNPMGTVYLNSNAICDQRAFVDETPYIAYAFEKNDVTTYTTLEFEGDTMKIETRRGDNSELLDSLTIQKDIGHNDNLPHKLIHRFAYKFVEFLGIVYQKIDNIVVAIRGGHF